MWDFGAISLNDPARASPTRTWTGAHKDASIEFRLVLCGDCGMGKCQEGDYHQGVTWMLVEVNRGRFGGRGALVAGGLAGVTVRPSTSIRARACEHAMGKRLAWPHMLRRLSC
jgi:hypothetical protein